MHLIFVLTCVIKRGNLALGSQVFTLQSLNYCSRADFSLGLYKVYIYLVFFINHVLVLSVGGGGNQGLP